MVPVTQTQFESIAVQQVTELWENYGLNLVHHEVLHQLVDHPPQLGDLLRTQDLHAVRQLRQGAADFGELFLQCS